MDELKIKTVVGLGIPLEGNDLDTDRVIPARFMKCVTFDELGQYLFHDARFNEDGSPKDHALNDARFKSGTVLIVRRNFGCGSSREHAPQSILRYGIRAIVGESFAEIFADNCTSIGLPVVTASSSEIDQLMEKIRQSPTTEIQIDLDQKTLSFENVKISVQQPEQMRHSLIAGTWDSTAELLSAEKQIKAVVSRLPYIRKMN